MKVSPVVVSLLYFVGQVSGEDALLRSVDAKLVYNPPPLERMSAVLVARANFDRPTSLTAGANGALCDFDQQGKFLS